MTETITEVPAQEQEIKPGVEERMHPRPVVEDDRYKGSSKLEGKKALVTGGDSGIGAAVCIAFAKEGADIVMVYRAEHERGDAERTRKRVEEHGGRCLMLQGDLREPDFCQHVVDTTMQEYGSIDVLVNHAGEGQVRETLEETPDAQIPWMFEDNIFSMLYLTKRALPHMKEGAAIVNTASVTAYRGSWHEIDYSATKGAVVAFTRSLAKNLAPRRIRVNGVAPGPIYTPLIPSARAAEEVKGFGSDTPLERPGEPFEMAPSYVFLASEIDSSYMTGEMLHPNGGDFMSS